MKAAGAAIDLFTLGQAMVLAGGVEAGAGIIVKTLAVEMVSNAAGYSAGYAANEMGMPLPVTWILSVATGCTVSATVGGYLFTSADGTITKCTAEEAGDLIKRLDKTDSPASFADMMSPEDAARYLRFLENGSTEGLTSAELEGIKKVDELLALKKISYQDVLDIRNSGKALEGGKTTVIYGSDDIVNYQYNMIENPGPLAEMPNQPAKNFYGGRYNVEVLTEDRIYYRGGNSDKALGQWFTTEPPESVAKVRIDTAVKPQWIDPITGELTGESVIDTVYAIKIPKGTTVYTGPVGSQGGAYCGGYNMMQTFIKEPWKLDYQVISKSPLK